MTVDIRYAEGLVCQNYFDLYNMGLSQIQKYCVEGQQEEEEVIRNKRFQVLQEDFRYFQEERWFSFQNPILFDHNIFIFMYPHYKEEQAQLLARWDATLDIKTVESGEVKNEEDALSSRWKYAIRRGVPVQYYKRLIAVIFNKNFSSAKLTYERSRTQVNFSNPVPLFGLDGVPREALVAPFLNDKGHQVLQDLMHIIKTMKGHFYNKYISHVAALLLVFFDEFQTYDLLSSMIEESTGNNKARNESMRWHFSFKEEQMKNMASSFYSIVGHNSPTVRSIAKCLERNSIDKNQLFIKVVENFFYGFLSFPFILRIFLTYLNEGVKIFFRIFYAMLVYTEKGLKEATSIDKAFLVLKKKCLGMSSKDIYEILKKSFNLNLRAFASPSLLESRLKKSQSDKKYYYLPLIEGVSHILSYQDLEVIWSFLPFELKTYDLKLIFPSSDHPQNQKLKLREMLKTLQTPEFSLIVIRTLTNNSVNVFGVFILGRVSSQESQQWYGNKENFLFTLCPESNRYISTRENNNYLFTGKNSFHIGSGGGGNAVQLNEDLTKVSSYNCLTFKNDPLNGSEGEFDVDCIEAFQLL